MFVSNSSAFTSDWNLVTEESFSSLQLLLSTVTFCNPFIPTSLDLWREKNVWTHWKQILITKITIMINIPLHIPVLFHSRTEECKTCRNYSKDQRKSREKKKNQWALKSGTSTTKKDTQKHPCLSEKSKHQV